MKLRIENFGPIKKADVVVGPMTVFVGPSNTGKTYLAILIYSVMKALGDSQRSLWPGFGWVPRHRHMRHGVRLSRSKDGALRKNSGKDFEKAKKMIEKSFYAWARRVSETWEKQVSYCFGGEENLRLLTGNDTVVKISDEQSDLLLDLYAPKESRIRVRLEKSLYESTGKDDKEFLAAVLNVLESNSGKDEEDLKADVNLAFETMFFPRFRSTLSWDQKESRMLRGEPFRSHYLPAIRGGIMQSHRTLVGSVIEQASMAGLNEMSSIPRFNGVLADFMKKLLDIAPDGNAMKRRPGNVRASGARAIKETAEEIGEKIMHGKIQVEKTPVNYPDFRYAFKNSGTNGGLPLLVASSMVSELAPVFLFLQHYVRKGDLFILEEPEAHLHPGAQREIANILVQLVNAGVRVLITTHSDIILEQVGNYVQAAEIGKKLRRQSLAKAKNSTYYFGQPKSGKQKKTTVEKVEFKPEIGFLTKDHRAVSSALYNETVSLLDAGDKS